MFSFCFRVFEKIMIYAAVSNTTLLSYSSLGFEKLLSTVVALVEARLDTPTRTGANTGANSYAIYFLHGRE